MGIYDSNKWHGKIIQKYKRKKLAEYKKKKKKRTPKFSRFYRKKPEGLFKVI